MTTEHKCCARFPVRKGFCNGKGTITWYECLECGKKSKGSFSFKKAMEAWNALFEQKPAGKESL